MSPQPQPPPSSSAAAVITNTDLLTEILSYLPIKPLLRFKTVNKHFHTTINHPSFSLLHSLRHPHPPPSALFLLLHHRPSPSSFSSISLLRRRRPPPPPPPSFDIVQSSNGLLLSLSLSPSPFPSPHFHILVSNPTTSSHTRISSGSKTHFSPGPDHGPTNLSGSGPGHVYMSGQNEVKVSGSGQDEVQVVGSGVRSKSHFSSGSGQGRVHVYGSGQDHEQVSGSGQGQVEVVGSDNGQVNVSGSGHGPANVSGSGQEHVQVSGSGEDQVQLSGLGQGVVEVVGQGQVVGVCLGFDPSRWAHYYVIRVVKHGSGQLLMDVYDLRTCAWRESTVCLNEAPFDTEFDRGVYWGGRVFWLSHTENMLYYDLESDVVEKLVLPKVFEQGSYLERFRYFGESCGHLHLIEIRTNCVRKFDVLELEEREGGGGLEWFVKYKVDLDLVGFGFEDDMFQDGVDRFGRQLRFYAFSILAVIRGSADECRHDDESFAELVLSIPGKVISYNFEKRVSRLICNVVDESDKWFPFRGYNAFQFIESLYCP